MNKNDLRYIPFFSSNKFYFDFFLLNENYTMIYKLVFSESLHSRPLILLCGSVLMEFNRFKIALWIFVTFLLFFVDRMESLVMLC